MNVGDEEVFTNQKTTRQMAEEFVAAAGAALPDMAYRWYERSTYWKQKYIAARRELRRSNKVLEAVVWKLRALEKK